MLWCWAAVLVIVAASSHAVEVKQENSLHPPFPNPNEGGIANWAPVQDSQVDPHFIRLTPDESHKIGGLWNYQPMFMNDWEVHLDFHIHGQVAAGGNGLALWYTRDAYATGPVFGYMEHFSGLGVFIDTSEHIDHLHAHPYISAVVNNGSTPYFHGAQGTLYQVGGCHMPIRNLHQPAKIAVSYINSILTVYLDLGGEQAGWQICLRSEGVHLPTGYYLGFTASTGDHSDNHDIISINTLNMNQQQWEDRSYVVPYAEHVELVPKLEQPSVETHHEQSPEEYHKQSPELHQNQNEEVYQKPNEDTHQKQNEDAHQKQNEDAHQKQNEEMHQEHKEAEHVQEQKQQVKEDNVKYEIPSKDEKEDAQSVSLIRKLLYISGTCVILYFAVTMIREYIVRRRERMHKRLF